MDALLKYIENIRKKPEHIRMRYVFVCVFFLMSIVVFVWVFSLHYFFGDILNSHQIKDAQEEATSWKGVLEEYVKEGPVENFIFNESSEKNIFVEEE